ncbi:hypothetical protein GCM10022257_28050 [Hyunsoonleella aestuarii]|uniref:Uncharacterized protein n=1 Tax=Hyunsoonleella aestuarii TaxID=912802 RepID=A0ABP8EF29_9FLAO
MFSLLGSIAISAIRPDIKAGPILLNLKPDRAFSNFEVTLDEGWQSTWIVKVKAITNANTFLKE